MQDFFSPLVAGFWRLQHWGMSDQALLAYLEECLALGVTTMDHAMVYRSEAPFGKALALKPSLRDKMQIITKFGIRPKGFGELGAKRVNHYDSGPAALEESLNASLRDLNTDHVDLLLVHRPDYLMDVEALAAAFDKCRAAGKVSYFGVSNFSTAQFDVLQSACSEPLLTNQVEFSPYAMEALGSGVFEQCQRHGARPMLWSCLAGGKLLAPQDEKGLRIVSALAEVKEELGAASIEQVVYAWVRALPSRPLPLLGSSKIERIRAAVSGLSLTLNREQWYRIWEASNGSAVP
jgi:predicted oxidoreductase